ncbi:universal stress protein [Haladaptatus sp. NG-WS-4]
MYENILVPTDGSEGAERAVELAIELATTYDAALHTLYVIDVNTLTAEDEVGNILPSLEDAAQDIIDDVVEQATDAGVRTTEAYFARGVPYKAIPPSLCRSHGVPVRTSLGCIRVPVGR